jgi:hypothetical protein
VSYRGRCEKCGEEVNPERDARRAAYRVTGYEIERAEGGSNQIKNRERQLGKVWHEGCLPDPKVNEGQEALL